MRTFLVLLVLCAALVQGAEAQRRRPVPRDDRFGWGAGPVQFGVRGGFSFEDEVAAAGAQLRLPLLRELLLVPSGDVFLGDSAQSDWQLNGDAIVRPNALGGLYGGGGVALVNHDSEADGEGDVDVGYNLIAGLDGRSVFDAELTPFVEARWTFIDDFSPFRLVLGINVPIR